MALVPRLSSSASLPGRDTDQMVATDLKVIERVIGDPQPDTCMLVAERDHSVAGFIYLKTVTDYYTRQPIGHVSDLVVSQKAEGQGIGRALMVAAEEWAHAQGYPMIQLNVLVNNGSARALYEKVGYTAEWSKYVKPLT